MSELERIIIHWTGGRHTPNRVDKAAYHFLIDGDGRVHAGDLPPEANLSTDGEYAEHTLNLNTGSIGVACCAMRSAQERPFDWGKAPLTEPQIEAMCRKVAALCDEYGIPVTRKTVLTHAEVQPTLKVKQRWKWDITVLPGMTKPIDPIEIGDKLRARIDAYREKAITPTDSPWAMFFQSIMRLFR